MIGERVCPSDELTGLPIPIMPVSGDLPLKNGSVANRHHPNFPASSPELTGSLGGRAVRTMGVQLLPVEHHNQTEDALHNFFAGPVLSDDRDHHFGMGTLSGAGAMAETAINLMAPTPVQEVMTPEQVAMLQVLPDTAIPTQRIEQYRARRMPYATFDAAYLALYSAKVESTSLDYRNVNNGHSPLLQELYAEVVLDVDPMELPLQDRIDIMIGMEEPESVALFARVAQHVTATTPYLGRTVADVYDEAWRIGRLHPNAPATAGQLIAKRLGSKKIVQDLLPRLRQRMKDGYSDEMVDEAA